MAIGGQELLAYACRKFEEQEYEAALEAFILSYSRGYEQEWVIETIYQCYVAGNEAEYRNAFAQAAGGSDWSYEACTLDFIPLREGEYYIFDRELMAFRGLFSMHELEETTPDTEFREMAFSGAAIVMDWNWKEEQSTLIAAKDRKVYAICSDLNRASSFFKIPELKDYWKNVRLFADVGQFQDYFHQHTAEYLPHILCGKESSLSTVAAVLKEEHEYRLTPEGRNTDHILLTIGIPTHDRGNLLLKRLENLQNFPYDAEIEFAISKHGTHFYQDDYKKVNQINDARIHYIGYDEELAMPENWRNVVKIAHGKFVMLVSDEDDVIVDAIEHYLRFLNDHPQLGVVRPRTRVQYQSLTQDIYCKKGKDAFLGGFLQQNYLSGVIYNKKTFELANLDFWDRNYGKNAFYYLYPHMWWQVILSFEADYAFDSKILISEGESVWKEETKKYCEEDDIEDAKAHGRSDDSSEIIGIVSTYEARISQFCGCVELIKVFSQFDEELRSEALNMLIEKTLYLMEMVLFNYHYKVENFPESVIQLVNEAQVAIDELSIGTEYKRLLLQKIKMLVQKAEDDLAML